MQSSKSVLLALIILISSIISFAQTDSTYYKSQIQFNLINGYSLSYLNFLSETSALRYKLDLSFGVTDGSRNRENNYFTIDNTSNTSLSSHDNENNSQMISLSGQYLYYFSNNSIVKVFIGTGPYLEFYRSFSKSNEQTTYDPSEDRNLNSLETIDYFLDLGIKGVFGIECNLTKQISLIGEYEVYAAHSWGKQKTSSSTTSYQSGLTNGYSNKTESDSKDWIVGLNSVKLGVAFRF